MLTLNGSPVGVLTQDGKVEAFAYSLDAVPKPLLSAAMALWKGADLPLFPALPWDPGDCTDPEYCALFGCWCRPFVSNETFHCAECAEPYDSEYVCAVYPRTCVACCQHASCRDRWLRRHEVPA